MVRELIVIGVILVGTTMVSTRMIAAVQQHHMGTLCSSVYHTSVRPDIPQCDKELWLRIKDGC